MSRNRSLEEIQEDIRTLTRVPSEFIHAKLDELAEEIGELEKPKWIPCSERMPDGWEHVSVSPKHKYNIPTWNDMCVLKDIFFDDEEEVYQIHPKKSEYVNLSENCLHLWKPIGHELGELVEKRYE